MLCDVLHGLESIRCLALRQPVGQWAATHGRRWRIPTRRMRDNPHVQIAHLTYLKGKKNHHGKE